jgi:hypothetical protein
MERIQEAFINNDFLLFLALRNIYTNGSTYYKNLLLWISKVSNGFTHYKQDYLRRALKFF